VRWSKRGVKKGLLWAPRAGGRGGARAEQHTHSGLVPPPRRLVQRRVAVERAGVGLLRAPTPLSDLSLPRFKLISSPPPRGQCTPPLSAGQGQAGGGQARGRGGAGAGRCVQRGTPESPRSSPRAPPPRRSAARCCPAPSSPPRPRDARAGSPPRPRTPPPARAAAQRRVLVKPWSKPWPKLWSNPAETAAGSQPAQPRAAAKCRRGPSRRLWGGRGRSPS